MSILISNFYPILFPMDTFQIRRVPYEKESFQQLRAEYSRGNWSMIHQWIETMSLISIPIIVILPIWSWISKRKRIVSKIQRSIAIHYFGLDIEMFYPSLKDPIPEEHNQIVSLKDRNDSAKS
jgi:hypothetical protein